MVSHSENGSDSPIGLDRDRGRDTSGLQKVSSSLQEVGNLPTRVYFLSAYCFGLGWALRAVWIVFPITKIVFC